MTWKGWTCASPLTSKNLHTSFYSALQTHMGCATRAPWVPSISVIDNVNQAMHSQSPKTYPCMCSKASVWNLGPPEALEWASERVRDPGSRAVLKGSLQEGHSPVTVPVTSLLPSLPALQGQSTLLSQALTKFTSFPITQQLQLYTSSEGT